MRDPPFQAASTGSSGACTPTCTAGPGHPAMFLTALTSHSNVQRGRNLLSNPDGHWQGQLCWLHPQTGTNTTWHGPHPRKAIKSLIRHDQWLLEFVATGHPS